MTDLGYIESGFQTWHDLPPGEAARSLGMFKAEASRELMPGLNGQAAARQGG